MIGGGHNGLACAGYLARAGLDVTVLEAAPDPRRCIDTVDLPRARPGRARGVRARGHPRQRRRRRPRARAALGLRFHERDEQTLSPCDDGTELAFWSSLERTVEGLAAVVGEADAEAYRRFAGWAGAATSVLSQADAGPPPSLRELAALAEAALGTEGTRLVQSFLAPATAS